MTTDTKPIFPVALYDFPQPPAGSPFQLQKIERISIPHPYCITAEHVAVASDHFGGLLDEAAIADAERRGAACDICKEQVRRRKQPRILRYDEHEHPWTLFITVPQNHDLNAIPGLHAYLLQVKEANLGVEGFAFPTT